MLIGSITGAESIKKGKEVDKKHNSRKHMYTEETGSG
jgi:hypothetical protein